MRFTVFTVSDTGRAQAATSADVVFQKYAGILAGFDVVWPQSADATAMAIRWACDVAGRRLTGARMIPIAAPVTIGELKKLLEEEARLLAYEANRAIRSAVHDAYFGGGA